MSRKPRCPQFDAEAEIVKPREHAFRVLRLVPAVEMVSAETPGSDAIPEHGVGRGQHRGGDRDDGLLRAPATLEAEELGAEAAVLLAGGGPCALDEGGLQPGVAGADAGGPALAGTLVEARTEPGPGDEMAGRGKAGHLEADLGDDDAGDGLAHAGPGEGSAGGA